MNKMIGILLFSSIFLGSFAYSTQAVHIVPGSPNTSVILTHQKDGGILARCCVSGADLCQGLETSNGLTTVVNTERPSGQGGYATIRVTGFAPYSEHFNGRYADWPGFIGRRYNTGTQFCSTGDWPAAYGHTACCRYGG